MKAAIVIPTLNAVKRGLWTQVLEAVAIQNVQLERKIIIDSASDDKTCAVAESYGWECRNIQRKDFNHGLTRNSAVCELYNEGIDTVVFLSQDVVLETPDTLTKLIGFLWNHSVAGCYGKQSSWHEYSLNAWQRQRCYPNESAIKTLDNVLQYGLMTAFFSNAFSAWKTADVIRYGGFPKTDFGEDMLMAAAVLKLHGAVGYCAEAVARHEHSNSPWSLFIRGVQIGAFHRQHPELLQQFGTNVPTSLFSIPWSIWIPLGIKFMGYIYGRICKKSY